MNQIWFGHVALREKAIWRNTFGWETSSTTIWNLIGWTWPLWTNKKTSQRHDTSCNRPPQSRQNESNDPLVLTAKNMFSLRSPCTSTNNNWQTLCCICHSHTLKTAQREETKKISSRHSATKECQMNSSPTSPVTQHTDQRTSRTNQKHASKIWYWDIASGQDLCENNLHTRTWAYQLFQLSTSQTIQHENSNTHERIICILQISHDPSSLENNVVKICRNETRQRVTCVTHGPSAIRRITLQSQHAGGLALMNRTYCQHSANNLHLKFSTWKQTRRLRGMNQKWPRQVALRKKVLDELAVDAWSWTSTKKRQRARNMISS